METHRPGPDDLYHTRKTIYLRSYVSEPGFKLSSPDRLWPRKRVVWADDYVYSPDRFSDNLQCFLLHLEQKRR